MIQDPRNIYQEGQQRATIDVRFYQERLKDAKGNAPDAIIENLDWEEMDKKHWGLIEKHIGFADNVIDIGCGAGRLAKYFRKDRYVGIDFIPEFIKTCKEENPHKKFEVVDINFDLPFDELEFDWAIVASIKGTMFNGDEGDPLNVWPPFEKRIKKIAKKILVLEYSRDYEEVI